MTPLPSLLSLSPVPYLLALLQRLVSSMTPSQLLRLNWWQRSAASVPPNLLSYCCEENGIFEIPTAEILMR